MKSSKFKVGDIVLGVDDTHSGHKVIFSKDFKAEIIECGTYSIKIHVLEGRFKYTDNGDWNSGANIKRCKGYNTGNMSVYYFKHAPKYGVDMYEIY